MLVAAHKARLERVVHAQQIIDDENLAIAIRAGANADGRYVQRLANGLCDHAWDALENDGKGSSLLKCQGVF